MHAAHFECPDCGAQCKVVRQDAADNPSNHPQVKCLTCGRPLDPGDGEILLKYFSGEEVTGRAQFLPPGNPGGLAGRAAQMPDIMIRCPLLGGQYEPA